MTKLEKIEATSKLRSDDDEEKAEYLTPQQRA